MRASSIAKPSSSDTTRDTTTDVGLRGNMTPCAFARRYARLSCTANPVSSAAMRAHNASTTGDIESPFARVLLDLPPPPRRLRLRFCSTSAPRGRALLAPVLDAASCDGGGREVCGCSHARPASTEVAFEFTRVPPRGPFLEGLDPDVVSRARIVCSYVRSCSAA